MNTTLVIVPTYNERENLPPLAKRLFAQGVPVDLLVVDDDSPDGTGQLADQLVQENASVHVLHRTQKRGLGLAYLAGFKWALQRDYEFVFELDGDGSHNPDDIPRLMEAAQEADLVLGSRYVDGIRIINWSLRRLILSRSASMYVRLATGMPFTDPTGGYKCFRRQALQALDLDAVQSNGYSFQIEITHKLWRQGMRIVEVPIIFTDRIQGRSKMSGQIIREALWIVWRLWFQNMLRRRSAAPAVIPRPDLSKLAYPPGAAGRAQPPTIAEAMAGRPGATDGLAVRPCQQAGSRDPIDPALHAGQDNPLAICRDSRP
jgi:dolichol-phosphate mannosyltransferase